ncbi:unnamed protein product [Brachionus calyciflorus]|uniref:Uncharacterized protein n=1 Tax=Brachionus calyciflorus TaxID=104777 RepID=A0A813QQE4_9BILA|nr:unnamed protein product [Brachionus calyciflorus]
MNVAMSLKTVVIWNQYSSTYLKSHIFKAFIRPILMYGIETTNLTKSEINDLRITEGIIIKRMIRVSNRCSTRNLFLDLNITPTKTFIENSKTEFLTRLIDKKLTNEIIEEMIEVNGIKDMWNSISHILDESEINNTQNIKLIC